MSKIPKTVLVFQMVILMAFWHAPQLRAQGDSEASLLHADSLFEAGKYTESFEVYSSILESGNYTSSMLLKLAFIREGLGDVSGALYYLNLYYNETSNKQALIKLGEIASENQLRGYEFGDMEFFTNLYNRHQNQVWALLFALSLLVLGLIVYQKRKTGKRPVVLGVLYVVTMFALFYFINFGLSFDQGIIIEQRTYLMTGPSAGADVVDIVEKGHRVKILGQEGIWVRIQWGERVVYVRDNKIKALG